MNLFILKTEEQYQEKLAYCFWRRLSTRSAFKILVKSKFKWIFMSKQQSAAECIRTAHLYMTIHKNDPPATPFSNLKIKCKGFYTREQRVYAKYHKNQDTMTLKKKRKKKVQKKKWNKETVRTVHS